MINATEEEKKETPTFKSLGGKGGGDLKRYTLVLPDSTFQEIKSIAEKHGTTILDILKKFIILGLLVEKVDETPGSAMVLRTEGKPDERIVIV